MTYFLGEAQSSTSVRARALKGVALSAVTLAMVAPGFAQAQDVQEVTITGSRIKAPNLTSDSPVTAVTQEEIRQSNVTAVENLLNNLPSVQADFTSTQSSLVGSTIATVNLRGLGATRTLVLIDGRRIGPGDPSSSTGAAADLNFIPTTLVKSVEVLTGGASAIYGSDAIAGVVNFHLMRDFQGAELDFSYTAAQHENNNAGAREAYANSLYKVTPPANSVFDGFVRETSGIIGSNSADGKGNVTMYADYRSTTPVTNSTRDWQACPITATTSNNKGIKACAGSSTTPFGKYQNLAAGNGSLSNNANGTATFSNFSNANRFNFASTSYLQRQDDRAALGSFAHYEVNDHVDLYAEMMYMNDSSQQQDGAGGLFLNGVPFVQGNLTIPCTNPYIGHTPSTFTVTDPATGKSKSVTQSQYQALGCGAGVANATIIFPSLRYTLPRQDVITHNDYRAVAGTRGDIDGNWSYDISASHWSSEYSLKDTNWALLPLVNSAITNGTLNIFQYGGDTLAQQQATTGTALEQGSNKEDDVTVSVSGDLAPYGGKSPFAASPIAVAAGFEYRHTTLAFTPDQNFQSGYVLGSSGVTPAINGGEQVTEEFGEVRVPLVQDKPFIQSLDLDLALRHSDYTVDNSSSAFSTNTWKISADYAPVDDVRLRGGYNRAARAPSVYELFQGAVYGNDGGYNDPCVGGGAAFQAACTNPALGQAAVTSKQYLGGGILQCSSNQCNNFTGGNLALKPEEADTWTWGANFTPSFLPGFTASVDYWDVKINNYINTLQGSEIVTGCYSGQTYYCQFIQRDPATGSLVGTGRVIELNRNLDQLHNRGLDIDLNYTKNIADLGLNTGDLGALSFHLTGTYLIQAEVQNVDISGAYNCAGLFGTTCGNPQAPWRHQARLTWTTPWNADFSVNWRYIGGVKLDADSTSNPAYGGATNQCGITNCSGLDSSINAYSYIDLSASYKLWEKYTFRAGVNNLMDKDPPMLNEAYGIGGNSGGQNGNTFTMYDTLGRVIYMSFSAKF